MAGKKKAVITRPMRASETVSAPAMPGNTGAASEEPRMPRKANPMTKPRRGSVASEA